MTGAAWPGFLRDVFTSSVKETGIVLQITPPRRRALLWAAFGIAFGLAYRYLVVQQHWIGHLCDPGSGPWWCGPRTGLILFFQYSGFGILAVLAGALALWRGQGWAVHTALAAGGAGLVLYNAETAGIGFVTGLIAALRPSGAANNKSATGEERL